MLALYGHPFSSYTWKALIPLYAHDLAFDFRELGEEQPENVEIVQSAGPLGKFPVLVDSGRTVFEATAIIEYLALHHLPGAGLIPAEGDAALAMRMMDRVFDNYVMNVMQVVVNEHLRNPADPDQARCGEAREQLLRTYRWLDDWLASYSRPKGVTLIECAAAPSLFYADWVLQIPEDLTRLKEWRAHLLALPPVARCVDDARPYRPGFPLGAPDRD